MTAFGSGLESIAIAVAITALIIWWKKNSLITNYNKKGMIENLVNEKRYASNPEIKQNDMNSKWYAEKADMQPKSWLSRYNKTSFWHLAKMGLFYTGIGLVFAVVVYEIEYYVFDYEEPILPASLVQMIVAGPVEETLFFGLPFSITGNNFVVLGTGIFWAVIHIFNASFVEPGSYSFTTVAFAIPHIFFSLRTWKSGKGWFAIFFHSAWNAGIFGILVLTGEISFVIFDQQYDGMIDNGLVIISIILLALTYFLYTWRLNRESKKIHKVQNDTMK